MFFLQEIFSEIFYFKEWRVKTSKRRDDDDDVVIVVVVVVDNISLFCT